MRPTRLPSQTRSRDFGKVLDAIESTTRAIPFIWPAAIQGDRRTYDAGDFSSCRKSPWCTCPGVYRSLARASFCACRDCPRSSSWTDSAWRRASRRSATWSALPEHRAAARLPRQGRGSSCRWTTASWRTSAGNVCRVAGAVGPDSCSRWWSPLISLRSFVHGFVLRSIVGFNTRPRVIATGTQLLLLTYPCSCAYQRAIYESSIVSGTSATLNQRLVTHRAELRAGQTIADVADIGYTKTYLAYVDVLTDSHLMALRR